MLLAPDGKSVYVSSWTTATVVQYALTSGQELARISVGAHPTEMVWLTHNRLAVACANTNFVFILGKDQQGKWQLQEKLNLALTPRQPVGMTPSSLSLSANRQTLYMLVPTRTPSRWRMCLERKAKSPDICLPAGIQPRCARCAMDACWY